MNWLDWKSWGLLMQSSPEAWRRTNFWPVLDRANKWAVQKQGCGLKELCGVGGGWGIQRRGSRNVYNFHSQSRVSQGKCTGEKMNCRLAGNGNGRLSLTINHQLNKLFLHRNLQHLQLIPSLFQSIASNCSRGYDVTSSLLVPPFFSQFHH